MNANRAEINPAAVVQFTIEDNDITVKLKSGRVLIWPNCRRKCLTIFDGKVIHDLQADITEMTGVEIGGVSLKGWHNCPACNSLHKANTVCECGGLK